MNVEREYSLKQKERKPSSEPPPTKTEKTFADMNLTVPYLKILGINFFLFLLNWERMKFAY